VGVNFAVMLLIRGLSIFPWCRKKQCAYIYTPLVLQRSIAIFVQIRSNWISYKMTNQYNYISLLSDKYGNYAEITRAWQQLYITIISQVTRDYFIE
jgi:hypothetical protein